MAHFTLQDLLHRNPMPTHTDTLVVGAGMAGLYTTWRIIEDNPNSDVCIIDKSNRTGGRLNSDVVTIGDVRVKEEEGGMRFTFDEMDNLMSLLMILGIDDQVVPFPMNSGGNNRLLFRGESFNNAAAAKDDCSIWSRLYNLAPAEQRMSPNAIVNTVFNRILEANPHFTERPEQRGPGFWQRFRLECQWNGITMKDWTLWNLFSDMGYSNECITMLYRASGFNGTFLSKMNAGVAYQLLEEFPADPQFRTLEDGFSTLPNALVERIGKERIYLKTQLLSIAKSDSGQGYRLEYQTIDEHDRVRYGEMTADNIVLGMPRLALEKLFVGSNLLNELPPEQSQKLWDTLQTATNQPLLKINLYYDKAWWGNRMSGQPEVAFGPNFSDSPLGSVYPFYAIDQASFAALEYGDWLKTTGKAPPSPEVEERLKEINQSKYQKPAALTIYCDYLNINFWQTLQNNGAPFDSPLQREYTERDPQTLYAASRAVVERATHYFKELFNTHYVPEPILTSARIWSGTTSFDVNASQEFDYGVHQWAVAADDRAVMDYLSEPIPHIYTCGEAFSDYQGWVEGALRSANLVLAKGFGLAPISEVFEKKAGQSPSAAIKASYRKRADALIRQYIDPGFDPRRSQVRERQDVIADADCLVGAISLSYFDKQ